MGKAVSANGRSTSNGLANFVDPEGEDNKEHGHEKYNDVAVPTDYWVCR